MSGSEAPESQVAARSGDLAHIPELDGVRGIAILLVLMFHCAKRIVGFGWMGVDLFFVLSGFLITSGLLRTVDGPHYLRNFYAKRALRIWPLYYLLLAYAFIALPAVHHLSAPRTSEWLPYAVYLQNLMRPLSAQGELGPTWSLAIEEHFYLVWPLVVRVASRRGLKQCGLFLIAGAPLARGLLVVAGAPDWTEYFATPCRVDALALGALLALYASEPGRRLYAMRRFSAPTAAACAAVAVPLALWIGSDAVNGTFPFRYPTARVVLFSLTAFASAGFVCHAVTSGAGISSRLLRAPWLRYIGKISYGVYIYHATIFAIVTTRVERASDHPGAPSIKLIRAFLGILVTLLVATVSWYALERPVLRLKALLIPHGGSSPPVPRTSQSP